MDHNNSSNNKGSSSGGGSCRLSRWKRNGDKRSHGSCAHSEPGMSQKQISHVMVLPSAGGWEKAACVCVSSPEVSRVVLRRGTLQNAPARRLGG